MKTLVISKAENNFAHYKKRFEALGSPNTTLTGLRRDALRSFIYDLKPELIIMGARYYHCSTPYMMGELHKQFPDIKMAALCIGEYPSELGMAFVVNGINSYLTSFDGVDQFYKGLDEILRGKSYISPAAFERLKMRDFDMKPVETITGRRTEVIRLTCNGFSEVEIADTLEISRNTVVNHRTEIYKTLNIRNILELRRAAVHTEILTDDELTFCPDNFTISPLPSSKILKRKSKL